MDNGAGDRAFVGKLLVAGGVLVVAGVVLVNGLVDPARAPSAGPPRLHAAPAASARAIADALEASTIDLGRVPRLPARTFPLPKTPPASRVPPGSRDCR